MKPFFLIAILISFMFLTFSFFEGYTLYQQYLEKTRVFNQMTKTEFDSKTKEMARNIDNKLINLFVKKTFLIGSGTLNVGKYIKTNQYNNLNLNDFRSNIQKNNILNGELSKCLKGAIDKNEEDIRKSCGDFIKNKKVENTLLFSRSISFFNKSYGGNYFNLQLDAKKKKAGTGTVLEPSIDYINYDYLYTIKNKYCEDLKKGAGRNSFYQDYLDNNKELAFINKTMCTNTPTQLNLLSSNEGFLYNTLFFLLNKDLYIYPSSKNKEYFWKTTEQIVKEVTSKRKIDNKIQNNILSKIRKKDISLKCYKTYISPLILNSEVYKQESLDKENIIILQNGSKKKRHLITCFTTFGDIQNGKITYKKDILQFKVIEKNNKYSKEDIKYIKRSLFNQIYMFSEKK